MSLKQKTVQGVLWTGMAKMTMQAVLSVVMIILANLLGTSDFGLVSMAALITIAIQIVTDNGLGTAIVQKPAIHAGHLSSLFWGSLAFGVTLFIISVLASYPMRSFFRTPAIQPVVIVLALGFIIDAFCVVQKALLVREMAFKKLGIIETVSAVVYGLIAIALALGGQGVWSLVIAMLVRDVTAVLLFWHYSGFKPKRHFAWPEFRELAGFSSKVIGNDVAFYLNSNADITIVGRLLGDSALGVYGMAMQLVKLPVTRLSGIVSRVTFPAFSAVQSDLKSFKWGYVHSMRYISLITFPILTGLALYAREFVLVVLGSEWKELVLPLIILVPMAMLKSVGTIRGSVLKARGKPQIEFWWNSLYLVPFAGAIYWGCRYGLVGASAAYTGLYLLTFPVIQYITNRQADLTMREFFQALWPAAVASVVMILVALAVRTVIYAQWPGAMLLNLIAGGVLCGAAYVGALWLIKRSLFREVGDLLRRAGKKTAPALELEGGTL